MARFTAPEKWNDEWFSNLKATEKLVFIYLTERCDNAGFFEINKRVDAFLIGLTEEEFLTNLRALKKTYVASTDGRKIWLKNFLLYQKNLPLNPENNAHKQILNFIQTNQKIFNYDFSYLGAKEGLIGPLGKGNSNGKGNGQVEEGGTGETILWTKVVTDFHNDFRWKEKFCRDKKISLSDLEIKMNDFVSDLELREETKDLQELKRHFTNLFNKNKRNGTDKQHSVSGINRFNEGAHQLLSNLKGKVNP